MKTRFNALVAVGVVLSVLTSGAAALCQERETTKTEEVYYKKSALVEKVKGGEIDWGAEVITATGEGRVPSKTEEPSAARAYLKAKGYARMVAIKNLLIVIEGAPVDYQGLGKDYMAQEELRQTIKGYVRNVQVIKEETIPKGDEEIVIITVGTRMYGRNMPGTALVREAEEKAAAPRKEGEKAPEIKVEIPKEQPAIVQPANVKPSESMEAIPAAQTGPFTSLVIDTRGFKVARCMSPKIRRNDGSEVWGTLPVSPDFAIEVGIASYVPDMETARKNKRCGDNPLIVKAIGRSGSATMCDAVISDEDAELIQDVNAKTKMADKCNVIFIVDP